MPRSGFLLLAQRDSWQVLRCRGQEIATRELSAAAAGAAAAEEGAELVAEFAAMALKDLGHRGSPIALGVPSAWCLSAPVDLAGLPARRPERAMAYRLEEELPIAAEDFTADFARRESAALGVAIETRRIAQVLEALQRRGVAVGVVSPAATLALQGLQQTRDVDGIVMIGDGERVDLFRVRAGALCAWRLVAAALPDLVRQLRLETAAAAAESAPVPSMTVLTVEIAADVGELCERTGCEVVPLEESRLGLAARGARAALARKAPALFDFRRGMHAGGGQSGALRRPLRAAALVLLVTLLALAAALFVRARRYSEIALEHELAVRQLFEQSFPGERPPAGIRRRLESKVRELRALGAPAVGAAAASAENSVSALAILHHALRRLPQGVLLSILDLRVERGRLALEGQARTHSDAETIATALGRDGCFTVEPPHTENLRERGVAFTIGARVAPRQATESASSAAEETVRRSGP